MKDSTNDKKPTKTPRIRRPNLNVKKLGGSDINWSKPYGNQVTHFVSGTKSLRQTPFIIIKKGNTFEVGPTMCVSIANERKTQVEWVVVVAQRVRK